MLRDMKKYGEVVRTFTGEGEILFPLGAKIQSNFVLSEYNTGKRMLICTGRFAKAGYASWEQLVSHYEVDPIRLGPQKKWPAQRFEGHTVDNQQLTIKQMFLIGSLASAAGDKSLTLQMQFECQDATLVP
ncbi:MAG TPA: hypothetical protein VM536_05000 [Chloroflexia bacterium]|nr:hypothetical protein [Chloroflexia bacterium]